MCALSIGISRTVLNGNVFELNFAFDDDDDKSLICPRPLKLFRQILKVFICRFPMWMNPRRAKGARGKSVRSTKKCVCFVSDSKVNWGCLLFPSIFRVFDLKVKALVILTPLIKNVLVSIATLFCEYSRLSHSSSKIRLYIFRLDFYLLLHRRLLGLLGLVLVLDA